MLHIPTIKHLKNPSPISTASKDTSTSTGYKANSLCRLQLIRWWLQPKTTQGQQHAFRPVDTASFENIIQT